MRRVKGERGDVRRFFVQDGEEKIRPYKRPSVASAAFTSMHHLSSFDIVLLH